MPFDDQRFAKGNHKEDTQDAAEQRDEANAEQIGGVDDAFSTP